MNERWTEVLARRIVEARLDVPLRQADHNVGHSVHDYDILFPDREPGALEVFVAATQADVARSAAHSRHAGEGFESALLARSWVVSLGPAARFKGWESRVEPFLVEVESRGLERLTIDDCWRSPNRDLLGAARELDLEIAHSFDSERGTRTIFVSTGYGGMSGSPDDGATRLETLLWETDDVRRKLRNSGRLVREAFVLVHLSVYPLWGPLDDGIPTKAISLPGEITAAWLTRGTGQGWRFEPSSGWEALEPIPGIGSGLPEP